MNPDAGTGGGAGEDPGVQFTDDGGLLGSGASGSGDAGSDGSVMGTGCGNGRIEAGEICDDANSDSGDGCSSACDTVEQDFACPTPGEPCVSTVVCGDGRIAGQESCDDGDMADSDGCSASCELETGWTCPVAGVRCEAAACGDGLIVGSEQCEDDDDPPADGDGCSATCRLEDGYVCEETGLPCRQTVCNDGTKEGSEPCDDGNNVIGDGCNPFCEVEPDCSAGACVSACGDGLILPGDAEECDDGNTADGDGCSASCEVELGFRCTQIGGDPDTLEVPVTYRDFISFPTPSNRRHADFEIFTGFDPTPGLVGSNLGPDGKPVYTGICEGSTAYPTALCPYDQQTTNQTNFDEWYSNAHPTDATLVTRLTLNRVGTSDAYRTPAGSLFPLDGAGHVAAGREDESEGHNFGFTTEIRSWFEFRGGEQLDFSGDDDVWVFVNGQLVLDLGGLHPRRTGHFTLLSDGSASWRRLRQAPDPDVNEGGTVDLGLERGRVYEIVLFHAERHTNESNFELTLTGFSSSKSVCAPRCGDGIVAGDEVCDDGTNDGSYGSCTFDCTMRGPFCGDGIVQMPEEGCDDGVNLTTYSTSGEGACRPNCQPSGYCGDGKLDSLFGERCDDGQNTGEYGACAPDCTLGPRCGDGVTQSADGETCDDGNTVGGDGCSRNCELETIR